MVTFNINNGAYIEPIMVQTGNTITAPILTREGYTLSWDFDFNKPITNDITIKNFLTAIFIVSNSSITGLTEYGETLNEIAIPNTIDNIKITSIVNYAFSENSSLTNVTIGNSITSIGWGAFYECDSLENIIVASGNAKYHSKDNCLIEANTLILGCKNSVIPNYVTSIGSCAFAGSSLASIEIPKNLTSIGEYAFCECNSLEIVFYGGTAEDWSNIAIENNNGSLRIAKKYYYIENESGLPNNNGNYWHYVDGVPTIWGNKSEN